MQDMTGNRNRVLASANGVLEVCGGMERVSQSPQTSNNPLENAQLRVESVQYVLIKRAMDICLASSLLLLVLPGFLLIALIVWLSSPGPIFYRERRLGRNGVHFMILKFRSMYTQEYLESVLKIQMSSDQVSHFRTHGKSNKDPRITPIGGFIRKWSLDELPQLINVLKGDMSLIGPRPIVKREHEMYGDSSKFYDIVAPGISGLWQVSGRSDTSFEERVALDKRYASTWSLWLDLSILFKTLSAVIRRTGAY